MTVVIHEHSVLVKIEQESCCYSTVELFVDITRTMSEVSMGSLYQVSITVVFPLCLYTPPGLLDKVSVG